MFCVFRGSHQFVMQLATTFHPKSTPGGTRRSIQNQKSQGRRDYLVSKVGEGSLIRSSEQLRTISRNLIRSSVAKTVEKGNWVDFREAWVGKNA